jgi:hypothetical protein
VKRACGSRGGAKLDAWCVTNGARSASRASAEQGSTCGREAATDRIAGRRGGAATRLCWGRP